MKVQELIDTLELVEDKDQLVQVRYESLHADEQPVFSKFDVESVSLGIDGSGKEKYVYIDI